MSLTESQIYFVKKAIGRRTKVIAAAIKREMGIGGSAITNRIIKARISKELHLYFKISRIAELSEDNYDKVLELIKTYRFYYCEKYFG
jgi:hypothetical protein